MDIRVAAYAVIVEDDRMLLAHWNEHGRSGWTLPGGGLEPGEHPEAAVRREVTEETGYTCEPTGLLGVDSGVIPARRRHPGSRGPLHAIRIVYRADTTGGALRDEVDGSTDEARWIDLAEVPTLHTVELVRTAIAWSAEAAAGTRPIGPGTRAPSHR